MTEEEVKPENTPDGVLPPDKKPDSQKNLTEKVSYLPTNTLRFQQTQEQKTMATDQLKLSDSANDAIQKFEAIKKALAGAEPEWRLQKIDEKALASDPKLAKEIISEPFRQLT